MGRLDSGMLYLKFEDFFTNSLNLHDLGRPANPTAGKHPRRGHASCTSFGARFVYRDNFLYAIEKYSSFSICYWKLANFFYDIIYNFSSFLCHYH